MYSGRDETTTQWVVPRRVMCGLFWAGVALIFIGMILLVTSQHKGQTFQSWGAVVLGLGLCILLSCVILCMHTYFVMSRRNRAAEDDGGVRDSKMHVNLTTDMPNGARGTSTTNRLARPPRYGISVTTEPPPNVRLYVSDIIDSEQQHDEHPGVSDTKPETIVNNHPQPDHRITSGGDHATAHGENGEYGEDGETWRRRSSTTTQPDRKSKSASGNSVVAATQSFALSDSNAAIAADDWLHRQQVSSRTVPLPFPPAHIKFDACENTEIVAKRGTSGLSSCDESFSQSTETIVARNEKKTSSIGDFNARRKSVYYNAEALVNSESDSPENDSSPVTLPRRSGSKRGPMELAAPNSYTSATVKVKVNSKSKSERRISSGGGSASTKIKDRSVHDRSDDQLPAQTAAAIDAHHGSPGTTPSRTAEHRSTKCRVSRINLHSDLACEGPSAASTSAAAAEPSPPLSPLSNANYSRAGFNDYVSIPVPMPTMPSLAKATQSRNSGIRGGAEVRFSVGDTSTGISAPTTIHERRTDGVVPTTARTCGPACVTVTPLRSHVVPVEQCSRFPPPPTAPASKTTRQHHQFGGNDDDDGDGRNDAVKSLNAADLLRSEYEASFGGQVNPLLLYSGGLADEDVNLSKSTVYDNIQYFKV